MNHVISLSGGKDSTAMLLLMLERDEPIEAVLFFDTGWEFPEVEPHLRLLEKRTGLQIERLQPRRSFEYWMCERRVRRRSGPDKGKVHKVGYGWPAPHARWCTAIKGQRIARRVRKLEPAVTCIGFAADEEGRAGSDRLTQRFSELRYPLIEWGVTEADALQICRERGYDWDGYYDQFGRLSCYCCPLQPLDALRRLRTNYPDEWAHALSLERRLPARRRIFAHGQSLADLDARFARELAFGSFPAAASP